MSTQKEIIERQYTKMLCLCMPTYSWQFFVKISTIPSKECCLAGMIGIGEPALLTETTGALHAFNIPLVSVMPQPIQLLGDGSSSFSNILTTAPDMAGQARVRIKDLGL